MSGFHIANLDAVLWLSTLPAESVDLVVTDPAYESLEKHRARGTTTRLKHSKASSNDWFRIFPNSRFPELFREVYRVLRKNSHFYMFCDQETMFVAKPLAEAAGFRFWKPIVWNRVRMGMGYHFRARYEFILFFEKGKRKLNNFSVTDIIDAKQVGRKVCDACALNPSAPSCTSKKGVCKHCGGSVREPFPTEKPPEVSEVLIKQSTQPGELVIDPFVGSGSVGVSAALNQRNFLGCDICTEAVDIAMRRLVESGATSRALAELCVLTASRKVLDCERSSRASREWSEK